MKYTPGPMRPLLCIALLLLLTLPSLQAQTEADGATRYRVELIVFSHAGGSSDAREVSELRDFSGLRDPLKRARELALADSMERQASTQAGAADPSEAGLADSPALPAPTPPPVSYVQQDALSASMEATWRRLQSSGEFRPLLWRAWYQTAPRGRATSTVRIHDEVSLGQDGSALLRWAEGLLRPRRGRGPAFTDLLPRADYRLDGSFRLRQRQFLHVDMDLHWREPANQPTGAGLDWRLDGDDQAPRYLEHRLTQSRAVRLNRLEYFDSARLGVLVRVERWLPPTETDTRDFDED